ncbi:MAG: pyridoxal-phosphate dependent enzyme [Lentimicrobium sp.]|nr:pyridoxal-phosphate dependent enzyme [Lentimicrobium sp.]
MEPDKLTIEQAAARIKPYLHHTPVLSCAALNHLFNADLFFKCENFQKAGAFKSRGATNAVFSLSEFELARGVATHSSGNHAAALALAASRRGAKAYIVMPENSNRIKIKAVEGYGGIIRFCKPTLKDREDTLYDIIEETGAIEIHPYNDYRIIAGQATAAMELLNEIPDLQILLSPVGGGGLLSGTALSARYFGHDIKVIACEPAGADDAFKSFYSGSFVASVNPKTIADGLLTSLGSLTYPIIKKHVDEIVTVSEESIIEAMRLTWERMKIIIEPSSAVPLAAILEKKINTGNKKTGIILSGGNVDLTALPF